MKKMTIVGAFVLLFSMIAGPAFAELIDGADGPTKDEWKQACEDISGEIDEQGFGVSGDPTCTVESEEQLIRDNPGVEIKSEGGETVYTHTGTETERNSLTEGTWDDGVTTGGGEVCITVKRTGKQVCPAGFNK